VNCHPLLRNHTQPLPMISRTMRNCSILARPSSALSMSIKMLTQLTQMIHWTRTWLVQNSTTMTLGLMCPHRILLLFCHPESNAGCHLLHHKKSVAVHNQIGNTSIQAEVDPGLVMNMTLRRIVCTHLFWCFTFHLLHI
jgi:hypothetical protein